MKPIYLSESAVRDLEGIARYTREWWGDAQTVEYLAEIEAKFLSIRDMPGLGMERPDVGEGLRSFPVSSHVIYYRETKQELRIVRILHQGMLPMRHLVAAEDNPE